MPKCQVIFAQTLSTLQRLQKGLVQEARTHIYGNMGAMKTTLDIPETLFRNAKATAALRGQTLKQLVTAALKEFLERETVQQSDRAGWRAVYGQAHSGETASVDRTVEAEFGLVDPGEWQ